MTPRTRSRLHLFAVAAAFLGTPLLAALWYAYGDAGQGAKLNRGTLVDPPRRIAGAVALGLEDRWALVVAAPSGCETPCRATLVMLRQVRASFGPDVGRIARLLVAPDGATLAAEHPDLRVLAPGEAAALLAALGPLAPDQAAVVDPQGFVMLTYAPGTGPADVKSDLKRLLKNSQTWMRR